MSINIFAWLLGNRNQRTIRRLEKIVQKINSLESGLAALTDAELRAKTDEFKQRLQKKETLDDILPEAFAVVREAGKRTLGMRHFDVQLIGGMVLHSGKIAEMHTGEGKTLVATLPAYLNALSGKGVHVITVNDYLAKRDAEWMMPLYEFLGMTVGVVVANMPMPLKQAAYRADITYGTNNEYGFDYLRDNMAFSVAERVQRPLNFAIIDEVDSILIDEARTPLIISGATDDTSEAYTRVNALIPKLKKAQTDEKGKVKEGDTGDFTVDEKSRQVFLTEEGHGHMEKLLTEAGLLAEEDSLYNANSMSLLHHVTAALRAHALFHRDVDYIVRNGEVIIIDEHTGRMMTGRRWSDGLHQAVEAKEHVKIQNENQTLASITFQNYFRLYDKLAGMTGTADTEAYEFHQIYGLEVVVIPTNKPNQRKDEPDLVYLTAAEKFRAVIKDIKTAHERSQPVLVGTASIETSEYLSGLLTKENIQHQVLNAKFHEKEAEIIAEAGRPGAVTIATNMAGRGTDIVLGGNLKAELAKLDSPSEAEVNAIKAAWQKRHEIVLAAGGLRVVGSERHESRRIDNQLRGRSARQGDPGATRFYLSLEDNLMRIFASPRLAMVMQKLGLEKDQAIEHNILTKAIENAQRRVESHNFDIRKQLLEYDDVANEQRKVVYARRNELMSQEDVHESIEAILDDVIAGVVRQHIPMDSMEEQWTVAELEKQLETDFGLQCPVQLWLATDPADKHAGMSMTPNDHLHANSICARIVEQAKTTYQQKEQRVGIPVNRQFEKAIMLQNLDSHWKEHLATMDYLRQSVGLRGYAQKDPKQEYKREAFNLFADMIERLKYGIISTLFRFEVRTETDVQAVEQQRREEVPNVLAFQHEKAHNMVANDESEAAAGSHAHGETFVRDTPKVGRNDPCLCGSGKKYKQCHGRIA